MEGKRLDYIRLITTAKGKKTFHKTTANGKGGEYVAVTFGAGVAIKNCVIVFVLRILGLGLCFGDGVAVASVTQAP